MEHGKRVNFTATYCFMHIALVGALMSENRMAIVITLLYFVASVFDGMRE